jgi:hypothetical protein
MPEVRAFQRHSDPTRAKGSVENAGKTERKAVGVAPGTRVLGRIFEVHNRRFDRRICVS